MSWRDPTGIERAGSIYCLPCAYQMYGEAVIARLIEGNYDKFEERDRWRAEQALPPKKRPARVISATGIMLTLLREGIDSPIYIDRHCYRWDWRDELNACLNAGSMTRDKNYRDDLRDVVHVLADEIHAQGKAVSIPAFRQHAHQRYGRWYGSEPITTQQFLEELYPDRYPPVYSKQERTPILLDSCTLMAQGQWLHRQDIWRYALTWKGNDQVLWVPPEEEKKILIWLIDSRFTPLTLPCPYPEESENRAP